MGYAGALPNTPLGTGSQRAPSFEKVPAIMAALGAARGLQSTEATHVLMMTQRGPSGKEKPGRGACRVMQLKDKPNERAPCWIIGK